MTQRLNDFISSIRLAESIEQEKFLIATEQARIRAYLRKMEPEMRPRVVSKLVFLDMIGQNPAWGQMEAITLMTDERFSYKRIGYISTGVLLDQTNELTVLVTQTLLKDLTSLDLNVKLLALGFIANLGSPEISRAVASEVQKLLTHTSHMIMKRAGMATVRIIRMNPDLVESYKNSVQPLLNSSNHGVVIAGMNLVIAMIEIEPRLAKAWAQFSGPFTKILKSLVNSRATREFSYGVFNDPYMQVKALRALALLQNRSDELDGLLQSIISSTVPRKNTGRSILFQAVETIVAVSRKHSLRALAFNQVGRLLAMRDANVLYSALSVFAKVLYHERVIIDRSSVDSMALQRYKGAIVKCLDHRDPSIRRRALDVISALIDDNNAETLIPEILSYLKLADSDFRQELVSKVYMATQRFSKSSQWNFDMVHQLMIDSGNYVSMDIISSFCDLISKTPALQPYAVSKLTESLLNFSENQTLMQVSAFVVGEFATTDNGAMELLRNIVLMPQTTQETKMYVITSLAKLSARFGGIESNEQTLRQLSQSNNLEVQQRAGEMMKLLMHTDVCSEMLAPIAASSVSTEQNPIAIVENTGRQATQGTQDDDILLLVLDDTPSAPRTTQAPTSKPIESDPLLDILDLGPATPQPVQQPTQPAQAPQTAQQRPQQPSFTELAKTNDLIVYGQSKVNPQDNRQIALRLVFHAVGETAMTEFSVDYSVSVGWQINVQKADGNQLMPVGGRPVIQIVYLLNANKAPFQLQLRAKYKFGTQPLTENITIKTMPQGE